MNATCPRCGHKYGFLDAVRDRDLMEVIRMQADFAPHSRLVFEYAELFGCARPMKAVKLLRILTEVREVFVSGQFAFQKRTYRISREGAAAALKMVCNKSFDAPLTCHNYLKKVMVSISEQESRARSARDEKELRQREAGQRGIARRDGVPVKSKDDTGDGLARLGEIAKKLPWSREG